MSGRVILRVEGHRAIGLGHFSRCLALAEMLQGEWALTFAMQQADEFVLSQIGGLGAAFLQLPDAHALTLAAQLQPGDIVFLDGYGFTPQEESSLREAGARVVTVDDFHHRPFEADVVINYCGGLDAASFHRAAHTRLCTGPEFLILRKEFLDKAAQPQKRRSGGKVFVTTGGSDPHNLGGAFLQTLSALSDVSEIHFLTSGMNLHLPGLMAKEWPCAVHFHTQMSGAQVATLLDECHLAVTSASISAWEVAAVHLPLLIMETALNQREVYRFLTQSHMALGFESPAVLGQAAKRLFGDPQVQHELMQAQGLIIHGRSPDQIRQLFRSLSAAPA